MARCCSDACIGLDDKARPIGDALVRGGGGEKANAVAARPSAGGAVPISWGRIEGGGPGEGRGEWWLRCDNAGDVVAEDGVPPCSGGGGLKTT